MTKIEVKKIVKALNASDGAGVKLKRSIGTPEADYIDPFSKSTKVESLIFL